MSPLLRSVVFCVAALTFLPVSPAAAESAPRPSCYEAFALDDYGRVVPECKALAIRGDARAQLYLGIAYAYGRGVMADPVFGYMWLEIAVSHGMSGWSDAIRTRDRVMRQLTDSQVRIASFLAREYWSDVKRWLATVTGHMRGGPLMPGTQINWPRCEFTLHLLQEPHWTTESTSLGELSVARAESEETAISAGCGPLSGELERLCHAAVRRAPADAPEGRSALLDYLRRSVSAAFAVEVTRAQVSDSVLGVQTQIEGRKRMATGSYRFIARYVCGHDSVVYVALLEPTYRPPTPEGLIVLDSLARR